MSLRETLIQYFQEGVRQESSLIGVELEQFIVHADSGKAAFYGERGGVRDVIRKMMALYPGAVPIEGEDLLGFVTDHFTVTLEPAAQLEISTSPAGSIRELARILKGGLEKLESVLLPMGLKACACGCQMESRVDEIPLIPKERYRLMDRHFQSTGNGGREMMRGTCSTQAAVDYTSEEDFRVKLQAAHYWLPALMLLMDHADRFQGEPLTGFLKRYDIWERTDPARCGILPGVFSPSYGFGEYAEFLERMPLILKETENGEVYTGFQTAGEIYENKEPDEEETEHILSMAFPFVRVKHYLEIRMADSVPFKYVTAYGALLKGLLYSKGALSHVQEQINAEGITEERLRDTMHELMQKGWEGSIYGRPARAFVRETLKMAGRDLEAEDRAFLEAFREVVDCSGIGNVEARMVCGL